jgi:hypothetical protein
LTDILGFLAPAFLRLILLDLLIVAASHSETKVFDASQNLRAFEPQLARDTVVEDRSTTIVKSKSPRLATEK